MYSNIFETDYLTILNTIPLACKIHILHVHLSTSNLCSEETIPEVTENKIRLTHAHLSILWTFLANMVHFRVYSSEASQSDSLAFASPIALTSECSELKVTSINDLISVSFDEAFNTRNTLSHLTFINTSE